MQTWFPSFPCRIEFHPGSEGYSGYLRKRLEELKTEYPCITERRGRGLMQGLELASSVPAGEISAKALQQGLILITAGKNVLRVLPLFDLSLPFPLFFG